MKKNRKNILIQSTLALLFILASFFLFSLAFGLQKNDTFSFFTPPEKTGERKSITSTKQLDFINFQRNGYERNDLEYILQHKEELSSLSAQSFLIGDLDTGEIIFEKKSNTIFPIASVTKFMTALTAIETLGPNELATITKEKVAVPGGNRAQFVIGDTLTIRELIYPLLLVSANDAGEIIAQQHNHDIFMSNMNQYAKRIGMEQSFFEDPTGLSNKNTSTAQDLFKMMIFVKEQNPEIIEVSRLNFKRIGKYLWQNINKAAAFPGFFGGKTGFTSAAKYTSIGYYKVTLANDQTRNIGVVILQSNSRESDTKKILLYLSKYVAYL
ncbi:MAG: serine hydrolase [Candidatus Pacebacteria bacterium]|nr:serine hydrolase [Candidatus Paceibacterota bacterium]